MQDILEKKQWTAAGSHFNGEGLSEGIPSLTPASQRFSKPTANSAFSNVYGLKTVSISMKPASSAPIGRSPSSTTL
jgi:hypothetical protein